MKFDVNSLNKYLSPQAFSDLNKFIESMPLKTGYAVLIAGGVVWLFAGLAVVYATTVAKDVAEIRAELVKSEALKPVVPTLSTDPVPSAEVEEFAALIDPLYQDITITADKSKLEFTASSGRFFGAFREAINHAYNGGQGWRLSLQSLCVGRECEGGFLQGQFSVNKLTVQR